MLLALYVLILIILHLISRYRNTREEKGYGKDELDLRLVDLCVSSSSAGNDMR